LGWGGRLGRLGRVGRVGRVARLGREGSRVGWDGVAIQVPIPTYPTNPNQLPDH
jgi:hypothetical protein